MTSPERKKTMVYTYNDNGDLIIVIKDAASIPNIKELVGSIIMAAGQEENSAESTELESETVTINDDSTFAAVAADFKNGRYNGPLRAEVKDKLNSYVKTKFGIEEKEQYVYSLSNDEIDSFFVNFASLFSDGYKATVADNMKMSWDQFIAGDKYDDKRSVILSLMKKFG